jgi:hypothetical protein
MYTARIVSAVALGLALLANACTPAVKLDAPPGFGKMTAESGYDYRAVNAHGVVVAARREPNDLHGDTSFWADSLEEKLSHAGYEKDSASEVDTKVGKAKMQKYTAKRDGRDMTYWLLVVSNEKSVLVVEAGGDKETFDKAAPQVEATMKSVALN